MKHPVTNRLDYVADAVQSTLDTGERIASKKLPSDLVDEARVDPRCASDSASNACKCENGASTSSRGEFVFALLCVTKAGRCDDATDGRKNASGILCTG